MAERIPRRLDMLDLDFEYRSGENNLLADFYRPCLSASISYDRASGYFRSSVMQAAGGALTDFAKRGGIFRLICSPDLTDLEIQAFRDGYASRDTIISEAMDREVLFLLAESSTSSQASLFATMISLGLMDVKIAFRPQENGIYHEKLGIFTDSSLNKVSFKGSANETWSGWHTSGNHESFDVFRSWIDTNEAKRVARHSLYFETLWRGEVSGLEILPFPKIALGRLEAIAQSSFQEVAVRSTHGSRRLLEHQERGVAAWDANGSRGILEHATGSGKTFTALTIIARHVSQGNAALVLVPSKLLLYQWMDEIHREIPQAVMLPCGAGKSVWRKPSRLESFSSPNPELGPRIIVATMQTARTPEFIDRIRASQNLLLVADEVHRTGSTENRAIFRIDAGKRLGLSATPERFGDEEGTNQMLSYFGGILKPPYTLADAIADRRLVPYEYHPHRVELSSEETERWEQASKLINREMGKESGVKSAGPPVFSDRLRMMLINRSRIAKTAEAKVALAREVIGRHFQRGQFWLVYCDNQNQLNDVLAILRQDGFPVNEYHSAMSGDPAQTLIWYSKFGGILVSIRCLDEGVDIPMISHALILASSQNPREYIQRRGRVLRVPPNPADKVLAVIHDALVMPTSLSDEPTQTSLVKSEIARAIQFGSGAINRGAVTTLMQMAVDIGLRIEDLDGVGLEDDDDAE